MITMEMLGKIRRMHLRDKMSLHAIAKQTDLSRNTLRRWLREPDEAAVPTYQRTPATGKLSSFHVTLELALKADAHRSKQNRRTAKALFAHIKTDVRAAGLEPRRGLSGAAVTRAGDSPQHDAGLCRRVCSGILNAAGEDGHREFVTVVRIDGHAIKDR